MTGVIDVGGGLRDIYGAGVFDTCLDMNLYFDCCIAVSAGAAAFVLMHNHPSGDPFPSKEDIKITKKIRELGDMMELPMVDHIIFGQDSYYSFSENENTTQ